MDRIAILKIDELNENNFGNDFYANTIPNHLISNHSRIEKPHKHNFYATMLFTRGSGVHEVDFSVYDVRPGSVFLLAPGQTHSWELSEDIDGFIFFHTQEFFDMVFVRERIREYPIYTSVYHSSAIYITGNFLQHITQLFEQILMEYKNTQWKKHQLILNIASQLYIELNRFAIAETDFPIAHYSQYNFRFLEFEDLLETHFLTVKSPAQYADWLHITPKHLNRITRSLVNKTTTDIVLERVVLEAKRMLIYTGKSFNEIASVLGYEDYSYFSKLFKKRSGETPRDFLKRYE